MSLWDVLSGAVDGAGHALVSDVQGVGQSLVSGLSFELKTNFGPAFILGGQYHAPDAAGNASPQVSNPGLLDVLGIQIGGRVIDAGGNTLFKYGDEPPTSPLYAAGALLLIGGALFLMLRGLRSFRH
jgi:hypothetical protein